MADRESGYYRVRLFLEQNFWMILPYNSKEDKWYWGEIQTKTPIEIDENRIDPEPQKDRKSPPEKQPEITLQQKLEGMSAMELLAWENHLFRHLFSDDPKIDLAQSEIKRELDRRSREIFGV